MNPGLIYIWNWWFQKWIYRFGFVELDESKAYLYFEINGFVVLVSKLMDLLLSEFMGLLQSHLESYKTEDLNLVLKFNPIKLMCRAILNPIDNEVH